MQVNQALPPPPDLGTNNSEPTGLSLVEQMKCKQLKPTQTKVTTLADLGYTDQDKLTDSKLGFREDEDPTEYFDEPGEFRKKALEVAELVKNAKRVVVFTGAGISTGNGANLPDYRGTEGVWTLHDKGLKPKKTLNSLESALPTYAHMALASLLRAGHVSYVVSTNVDGLHLRSGIPESKLSELHGDAYLERCSKCSKPYLRDFDVTRTLQGHFSQHKTGRTCDDCGVDSIVHFGENLPEKDMFNAEYECYKADLALVLGTSMRVSPANTLPSIIYKKNLGKMVICNLQITPSPSRDHCVFFSKTHKYSVDKYSSINVKGYTDDLLHIIAQHLGVSVDLQLPTNPDLQAPEYVDHVDEIYTAKQEVWKKQYAEWNEKKKQHTRATLAAVLKPQSVKREKLTIEGKKGRTETILNCVPSDLLLFKDCRDCHFTVGRLCTKVLILNCSAVTFTFKASVLTSCLEVIHCDQIRLISHVPLYTISVDDTSEIEFEFEGQGAFQMIVTNKVTGMVVKAGELVHEAKTSSDTDTDTTQYFTGWVNNKIETDVVVRQGEGGTLVTTQKEAEEYQQKQAEAAIAMEKYVRSMFRIDQK